MDIDELEVEDDDDLLAACGLTPLRLKSQPTASLRSDVTGKEPQCGLDNTQGGSWECPAGRLQKAMEAGVQVTGLDDVLSDNGTRAHNSEQNRAGDLDFSSEAWRTAMSTLDVEEFDASSPILQHNVASVKKRRAAGKIPQIILLVVSMKANTPGNILAKLK
eukprot:jgi/Tetstr1/428064/TSEL_018120.t1